jgi:hypothetical protein
MSERCTVVQLRNGVPVYVQEPMRDVVACVQDPGGAPFLELTASEQRGGKPIWIRCTEIATLCEAELFTDEEKQAAWKRQFDKATGEMRPDS